MERAGFTLPTRPTEKSVENFRGVEKERHNVSVFSPSIRLLITNNWLKNSPRLCRKNEMFKQSSLHPRTYLRIDLLTYNYKKWIYAWPIMEFLIKIDFSRSNTRIPLYLNWALILKIAFCLLSSVMALYIDIERSENEIKVEKKSYIQNGFCRDKKRYSLFPSLFYILLRIIKLFYN